MSILVVLASLLAANPASPARQRVAVLPIIIAPKKDLTASQVFKQVTDAADLRPTLRVMSIDDYYFHDGGELANRALACGADTACIARQLAPFDAQLGVVVIANLELEPPLLSVLLLSTAKERVIGENTAEVPAERVIASVLERTSALFDEAGHPRSGRLVIDAEPGRATVTVEGIAAKSNPGQSNAFTLPPGDYRALASLEGYEPGRTNATVKSGETTSVRITLEKETSILESPWFWVISSAVVVAAGATAAGVALSGNERCFCVVTADRQDCSVCQ